MKLALPNNENLKSIFFTSNLNVHFTTNTQNLWFFSEKGFVQMKIPVVKFVHNSMKCSLFLLKFFNYNAFFGNFFQTSVVFFSSSNFFVVLFAYEAEDTFSFRGSDAWAHNLRG